jgi:hypothetical protein
MVRGVGDIKKLIPHDVYRIGICADGAANISGFTLDLLTGALTPMAGSPFPAGSHPQFIATF